MGNDVMVKGTRERIINSYFNLALKNPGKFRFTIAEIAMEAGISRQAIYKNHFNTPEDIMIAVHQEIDYEIEQEFNSYDEGLSPLDFFTERIIPILYKNRNLLRYLYMTNIDPEWRLFLKNKYTKWVKDNININNTNLCLSKDMSLNLFVNMFLAIIESWIIQPIPETPDLFAKQLQKISNCSIRSLIS